MPIRIEDPFRDPTENLDVKVNPFLGRMRDGMEHGTLPIIYGPKLKPLKGGWRQEFSDDSGELPETVVLEIGSHMGEVLRKMATSHPKKGFVGLDITFKRVVTLAEKAQRDGLPNIRSLLCNGRAISKVFAPKELEGVIVFFPDPWAKKKRQAKNRLVDEAFIRELVPLLKDNGFFWFKTDHLPYFQQVCEAADKYLSRDPSPEGLPGEVYESRFERHFREIGQGSYQQCWRARP